MGSEDRLTDVEIKIAYLEKAHLELDAVVRELAAGLADLRRELERLRAERVPPRGVDEDDEPPPHY
jgi:uncharacterized coiled-coil protein SlyX